MRSHESKLGTFIILMAIMIGMLITSSTVLLFKFLGKEKMMDRFESLGIIKNREQEKKNLEDIKEEINEIPYLRIFTAEEGTVISSLSHEEKILYYKVKKVTHLNVEEIKAVIDLMKKIDMPYDYFLCAQGNNNQSSVSTASIYDIVYPIYPDLIEEDLKNKSSAYKDIYLKALYFGYLANLNQNDFSRVFLEYNMGYYEAIEYYRRNNTYHTPNFEEDIKDISFYENIYRFYLKSKIQEGWK